MRAMTADDLYEIAWVNECDISPDASRVACSVARLDRESDSTRSAIYVVDTGGGTPRQFTAGAKRDSSPRWSPDGRWLAFLSERGEEKPQLYVMPSDGGESRRLTDLPLGAAYPVWSPDSTRIAFSARTGTPPDPDPKKAKPYRRITTLKYRLNGEGFTYDRPRHVYVVGIEEGATPKQITDGDWEDTEPAWSPDGSQIAFNSARHETRDFDSHSDLWVVSADGGEARKLTETWGRCGAPSWSPDGQVVAHLHTPEWPSNSRLRLADAAGGNLRYVDPNFDRATGAGALPGAVAMPAWLPDGSIVSIAQDCGAAGLIAAKEGKQTRWVNPGAATATWYSVDAAGRTAAIVTSGITRPGEVALVDLESGKQRPLTNMNAQWLEEVEPVGAERFAVALEEGVDVDCWIMKPAGLVEGRQYPVLLNVHGGPFGQYGETFFDEFQVYAGAGYGVVFCNPRGSSGQDTAFARALVGDMGGPDYRDVMAAFDGALERMPWADRDRLGVMGGSYGGFMTTWVIGHSDRFAAACSERAVNDWYGMQGQSDIGSYFNRNYLGDEATIQENLDLLMRQSPLSYAKDIQTPVLILHSEDDLRCPIAQAEQLWVILKQLGRDVEFVRFPDENHEMSRSGRPSHRVDRFEVILDYFGRKLGAEAAVK